jgi:aminomethyltransferase
MKKSTFFDFLNRHTDHNFESFLAKSKKDIDYIDWHDYCLPMEYGDAVSEYKAVRSTCALFDISPVKKYTISGADVGIFLDTVMTRQMSKQKPMRVIYATFCNEDGMLLDDGLLYKFAKDNYLLMISEIDHDKHFAKISNRFADLQIEETTLSLSGLAFQGPESCRILNSFGFASIENLKPFEIKKFAFGGGNVTVARAGFTADLGYELWFDTQLCKAVEKAVRQAEVALDMKINGYGLKALNALRLEGGFIVPGWDTAQIFEDNADERTPAELGISWTVDLDRKEDFIGKAALLKEKENGPRFKTIGLSFDLNADQECDVEDGMKIYTIVDGKVQQAGIFPSVAWSSELNCWLGIASIKSDFSSDNLKYYVQFGEEQITCRPIKLPFVKFDRYREIPATL